MPALVRVRKKLEKQTCINKRKEVPSAVQLYIRIGVICVEKPQIVLLVSKPSFNLLRNIDKLKDFRPSTRTKAEVQQPSLRLSLLSETLIVKYLLQTKSLSKWVSYPTDFHGTIECEQ